MKLIKFCEENYLQYAGVSEVGTNVALVTETKIQNGNEREIVIDDDGIHIHEIDWQFITGKYLHIPCAYELACSIVLGLTGNQIFEFKLEED